MVPASVCVLMVKSFHVGVGWAISSTNLGSGADLDGIVPAAIVMSDSVSSSLCCLESDWSGKCSIACTSVFLIIRVRVGVDSPSDGGGRSNKASDGEFHFVLLI